MTVPIHGQICYLQIPALDPMASAGFYENVFGWQIEPPYPSFESPGLIGQWTSDLSPSQTGPLLWINVDDIHETLKSISANGGEVIEQPKHDGPRLIATFRDPGGNVLGVAQHV